MARILCTGVAGFMLSHLSEYLANEGHEVYGIDSEAIGFRANVPENIKYAKADLRNPYDIAEIVAECKPDIIYHGASFAHEGLSQFMPRLITENNYNAFLNLVVPAIKHDVKRFVTFSSMSVYGDQQAPFDETMPTKPVDVYAVAKASMEKTLEVLSDVHGFEYTIIRPHNVVGPRQNMSDPYRNVAAIMMNRVLKDLPPIIYGDGEQTRAFTYIDDVTPYVAKAGFLEEASSQIINIGPTEDFSINYLADTILKTAEKTHLTPIHILDRPKEVKHAFCTNKKAQDILGYKTSISFEDGIRKMWKWAKIQGPQEFKYLEELELEGKNIPLTWKNQTI